MGYIDKNLMNDEEVVYQARIHWFIYAPAIFLLLAGIPFTFIGAASVSGAIAGGGEGFFVIGISFILVALILIIRAFITRRTTELGITTKRVIAKIGLIRRNTIELNHSKVESFNVDQSILGRILDFGTIIIQGTGGGKTPIKGIDSPLKS